MAKNDRTQSVPITNDRMMGIMALGYYDKKKGKISKEYDSWTDNEQVQYELGRQLMAFILAANLKAPVFDIWGAKGKIPQLVMDTYFKAIRLIPNGTVNNNFAHFSKKA